MSDRNVEMSQPAADGLSAIGIGRFDRIEPVERMAFIILVLRCLPDNAEWFPRGKWATIQHIESQIEAWVRHVALGAVP